MAEADKDATNYWCKYCKTFVRNSPLEKRNHESSPRHQGSLQRFLKELHKTNERESREKQRAKEEVARLNGDSSKTSQSLAPPKSTASTSSASKPPARQATKDERRQQMAQLAAMGVVVPEEFRRENAMAGEWERTTNKPTAKPPAKSAVNTKPEANEDPGMKHEFGCEMSTERKRKLDDDGHETHESQKSGRTKRKPNWGTDVRQIGDVEAEDDLDALLVGATSNIVRKDDHNNHLSEGTGRLKTGNQENETSKVKLEEFTDLESRSELAKLPQEGNITPKELDEKDITEDIGSMFKKKKKKALPSD